MSGKQQNDGVERTKVTNDPSRSTAEWVSLGISLTILVILVGLVFYAYLSDGESPPVIEARPRLDLVRNESGSFYLPVDAVNTGNETAQEVSVQVTLSAESGQIEAISFTIPFLAGGETAQGVVIFQQDPIQGEVQTTISFLAP